MAERTKATGWSIGAVSRRTGVGIETIRYYERIGMVPAPARTPGGNRVYDIEPVKRLAFIRRCRELGFGLDNIRVMLGLVDGGTLTCGEIHKITSARLDDVRARISDLQSMETVLGAMVVQCGRGETPDCPIIDSLYGEA
jgi:MerR family mercuric resistance operon transcriptional regulator